MVYRSVYGCPEHKRQMFFNAKGDKCKLCRKEFIFLEKVNM